MATHPSKPNSSEHFAISNDLGKHALALPVFTGFALTRWTTIFKFHGFYLPLVYIQTIILVKGLF